MADDINTMQVQAVAPEATAVLRSQTVVRSLRLRDLQTAVLAVAGGGPTFAVGQEPTADGVAYTDTAGTAWYRPQLGVAARGAGRRPGPDVWFLKDDDGVITLTWTLDVRPFGGQPEGAQPLPLTVTAVALVWADGRRAFDPPGLTPVEGHATDQAAFRVQGGAQLTKAEAAQLESAMNHPESAARLEVTYTYTYTVQTPVEPDAGPVVDRPDVVVRDHRRSRILRTPKLASRFLQPFAATRAVDAATTAAASADLAVVPALQPGATDLVFARRRVSPALRDLVLQVDLQQVIATQQTRPESRTQTVTRTVPFVFEPSDEQNGPIYRSLHGSANLGTQWQHGAGGWVRESVFPNTVNRLPDAMRLAWNPELGGPHMVPTLHRDADGRPRVRLLLRLAPYQDANARVTVRRLLGMPAASIVIGEVASSTMRLGGSFPEELSVVGDAGAPAPLTGVDLTLDLSLAYYQLFCQQIATPVGVPGQVSVVLDAPPAPDGGTTPPAPETTTVGVGIRLDRVDDLPCTLTVPDTLSPSTVTLTNASGIDLVLGGAAVTLLQTDADSAVPVDTFPGRCTSRFPLTVAAGASVELAVEPDVDPGDTSAEGFLWNAVLLEVLDKKMTTTPDVMLAHVHELAGGSEISRDITVSSPLFSTGTLPPKWADLASIEVEVTPPGGHPVSVVLSLAAPSQQVAAAITLQAVAAGASGGITTVSYRVRNNYLDHQGAFGPPQSSSGSELVAYPNPTEPDPA